MDKFVDAKVVPGTAIRKGPNGTFVYMVAPNNVAEVRSVQILLEQEGRGVIGNGVRLGARVVTAGFDKLRDGATVQILRDVSAPGTAQPAADETPPAREKRQRHKKDSDPADKPVEPARETKEAVR
jgi:membrane fusion protein, multidrug efflux system